MKQLKGNSENSLRGKEIETYHLKALGGIAKAVLRGKFIVINTYMKK